MRCDPSEFLVVELDQRLTALSAFRTLVVDGAEVGASGDEPAAVTARDPRGAWHSAQSCASVPQSHHSRNYLCAWRRGRRHHHRGEWRGAGAIDEVRAAGLNHLRQPLVVPCDWDVPFPPSARPVRRGGLFPDRSETWECLRSYRSEWQTLRRPISEASNSPPTNSSPRGSSSLLPSRTWRGLRPSILTSFEP